MTTVEQFEQALAQRLQRLGRMQAVQDQIAAQLLAASRQLAEERAGVVAWVEKVHRGNPHLRHIIPAVQEVPGPVSGLPSAVYGITNTRDDDGTVQPDDAPTTEPKETAP